MLKQLITILGLKCTLSFFLYAVVDYVYPHDVQPERQPDYVV